MSLKHKAKKLRNILRKTQNEKGQSFVEFLFLFVLLVGISYTMVAGFNGKIGERWTQIINIVASDNLNAVRTDIELN